MLGKSDVLSNCDDSRTQQVQEAEVELNAEESIEVSLVIPVYNQSRQISLTIDHINKIMNSTPLRYEIIIVNDGSTDDTLEILQRQEKKDPRLKVFSYDKNRGKGYAVRTGIMNSNANVAVFIDSDFDISPYNIIEYIMALESGDLIVASKAHPLSKVNAPLSRRILSKGFNLLVRLMLGLKIKDTQSGLKVGKGDILRLLFEPMTIQRYAFDVELLAIAHAMKLRIKEMPINLNIDARFKVRDILVMFRDVMSISYRYRKITSKWQALEDKIQNIRFVAEDIVQRANYREGRLVESESAKIKLD